MESTTPNGQVELIRSACIKAQPNIVIWACDDCNAVYETETTLCSECNAVKVFQRNRNIHLADVLLAIEKRMGGSLHLDLQGVYVVEFEKGTKFWDLMSDSLESQSPETKAFIYNLLK